jgi:hypothetical protein
MPRVITDIVLTRLERAFEYIKNEICITTKQIIDTFGLTHSQAFYVLQMLRNKGMMEEYVIGRLSIWCIAGHVVNDVYIGDTLISVDNLERAICEILGKARGRTVTIRPSWVADIIAEDVHVKPRMPLLLSYISGMLPIMLSNVKKITFKNSRNTEFYVVDTCSICNYFAECPACEMLKKRLNCLD